MIPMDAPFKVDFDTVDMGRTVDTVLTAAERELIMTGPVWVDFEVAIAYVIDNRDGFSYLKTKNMWYQFFDYDTALETVFSAMRYVEDALRMGIYRTYGSQHIPLTVVQRNDDGSLDVRDGTPYDTSRVMKKRVDSKDKEDRMPPHLRRYLGESDTINRSDDVSPDRYWNLEEERT